VPRRYSQSSFTLTSTSSESVSFTFNGTGVQIYGAKRGNHGPYHSNLDNGTDTGWNGTSADPGLFQTSLYSVSGLQQGLHRITLTNDANAYIDIDFVRLGYLSLRIIFHALHRSLGKRILVIQVIISRSIRFKTQIRLSYIRLLMLGQRIRITWAASRVDLGSA
jgi:hypothetical protein